MTQEHIQYLVKSLQSTEKSGLEFICLDELTGKHAFRFRRTKRDNHEARLLLNFLYHTKYDWKIEWIIDACKK